ncbi:MAG: hypothetical protein RLZZ47_320, partial [Bacteroidota bacterium]
MATPISGFVVLSSDENNPAFAIKRVATGSNITMNSA